MARRKAATRSPTHRALRTAAAAAAVMGARTRMGRKAGGKGKVIFLLRRDDNMVSVKDFQLIADPICCHIGTGPYRNLKSHLQLMLLT